VERADGVGVGLLEGVEDGGDAGGVGGGLFVCHDSVINWGKVFRCDRC